MQFGINKCGNLAVRGEVSIFLINSNPNLFIFQVKSYLLTNCSIYLGVSFSNDLELKLIVQRMNSKVRKSSLFYKRISLRILIYLSLINECYFQLQSLGKVSYYVPLLVSNKERTRSIQTLVNTGLY